jgi:ubiquinone/menaquinone biosynthesis C-methylase UbiE
MPNQITLNKQLWEQTFDGVASSYHHHWYFAECGARLVELMSLSPGMNLLDVATGTGAVLLPAARLVVPNGRVRGIDISDMMLQQAQQAAVASGLINVDLLKMDAEHLDFPDASFDAVTCGFGIFFFPDMGVPLREMYRVCKPGGLIGLTVFDKTVPDVWVDSKLFSQQVRDYKIELKGFTGNSFAPEEMGKLLTLAGFRSVKTTKEIKRKAFFSIEDIWEQRMSGGHRAIVLGMDAETRSRFKEEYLSKMRQLSGDGVFNCDVPVMYSVGIKD